MVRKYIFKKSPVAREFGGRNITIQAVVRLISAPNVIFSMSMSFVFVSHFGHLVKLSHV
jgi:hypothetical protein